MIQYSFFFLFFIISCEKDWSNTEIDNFLERCRNNNVASVSKQEQLDFCECILEKSLKLEIPYNEFLKKELSQNQKNQIINFCID